MPRTSASKVHFELLLGKLVRDPEGARVGRILSVMAEIEGSECLVREYHLGTTALMSRLGISVFGRTFGRGQPLRVPWELMDLSDPEHPRLRCLEAELPGKAKP